MNDEQLLLQACQGHEAAFRQLYQRHRDIIFRFAFRMLQSVETAEEIAHDCFLILLQHPQRFDANRASLRTYLCAITRNLARKHLRDFSPTESLEESDQSGCLIAPDEQMFELLKVEITNEVRRAISLLPPLQREAVILFEYEELTLAEIALIVNADVGTVKSRLYRARENLRRSLTPYFEAEMIT